MNGQSNKEAVENLKPGFHSIVSHRQSLSYSIGDDRRCFKTMIGDELRFNENQA